MTNRLRSGGWPDEDEAWARLTDVIVAREVEILEGPHVVVCRAGSQVTVTGPYPSGLAALCVAIREQDAETAAGHFDIEYDVAPLLPPRDES